MAPADCSPGAPTDPDVRSYRIRLLGYRGRRSGRLRLRVGQTCSAEEIGLRVYVGAWRPSASPSEIEQAPDAMHRRAPVARLDGSRAAGQPPPVILSEAMALGTARVPLRVDAERVRLVWASGYWDGPLSGLAELDGESVWFEFADEENEDQGSWYRRFFLLRLPPERLAEAHARHAAFQRFVGTHFDYRSDGRRDPSGLRARSEWQRFYDAYPPESTDDYYFDCDVVGWFEL